MWELGDKLAAAERDTHLRVLYQVGENDHGQRSTRSSAQALGTGNLAAFTAEARDNHRAKGADVSGGDRADGDLVIGRSKQLFLDLT